MGTPWLPPLIVISMLTFIYTVFSTCNLIPQILRMSDMGTPCIAVAMADARAASGPDQYCIKHYRYALDPHVHQSTFTELIIVLLVFHVIFLMLIICIWKSVSAEPGWIPDNKRWRGGVIDEIDQADEDRIGRIITEVEYPISPEDIEMLRSLLVVERKQKNGKLRECLTCRMYKPDRSHHCRICGRCVLRMDHHCPWIANCVGWNNYKYFLLMLFYALLETGFVLGAMLPRFVHVFRPVVDVGYFFRMDLPVFFAYSLSIFLFSCLLAFFIFHIYLVLHAMTTIEMKEKKNSDDKEINHRFQIAHLKYDHGWWKNFCHVFGPPWLWILPIRPAMSEPGWDGTYSSAPKLVESNKTPKK